MSTTGKSVADTPKNMRLSTCHPAAATCLLSLTVSQKREGGPPSEWHSFSTEAMKGMLIKEMPVKLMSVSPLRDTFDSRTVIPAAYVQ